MACTFLFLQCLYLVLILHWIFFSFALLNLFSIPLALQHGMQLNGLHQWALLLSGCWYSCYWFPLAGDSRVREKWSLGTFSPNFLSIRLQFDAFPWQRSPLYSKFCKSFSQIVPLGQRMILAVITTISKSDTVGNLSVKWFSVDFPKVIIPHHCKRVPSLKSSQFPSVSVPTASFCALKRQVNTDIKVTLTSKYELHTFVAFLL